MCFCMCAPICCKFQIYNIVAQFWVYAIVFCFRVVCTCYLLCHLDLFKLIPGSEVVYEFGARVCPEMFL